MQLHGGDDQPEQNPGPADARHRARMEFLHAGQIGIGGEFFMQMRIAHDQQRDQQRNEKAERKTKHESGPERRRRIIQTKRPPP